MSYLKMPFKDASFVAFLLVSYVTGITSTVDDYAEQAAQSLADVTSSNSPEWYSEGMQLLAFKHNRRLWHKKEIVWTIEQHSTHVPKEFVEKVFEEAFEKWSTVIPKTFKRILPEMELKIHRLLYGRFGAPEWDHGNIGIRFKADLDRDDPSYTSYRADRLTAFDTFGVDIIINDNLNWTDENRADYHNLRFAALHEIGHVLGLADSDIPFAVMSETRRRLEAKVNPVLHLDDIEGVQKLYGTRDGEPSQF